MGKLDGKVALISGTAGGQGRAAALAFASEGASVFGCDVLTEESEETVRLVQARDGDMRSLHPCDVSDFEQAQAWISGAIEAYGRIDVLYNNAGALHSRTPFGSSTIEDWNLTLRYELTIVYAPTLAAWPHFERQGHGVVINTASVSGYVETYPLHSSAHGVTKAGVMALTRTLAAEGARSNIRAVSISPGPISRPVVRGSAPRDAGRTSALNAMLNKIPAGRFGLPEDIAKVAVFLASDDAAYVNGTDVRVDGGFVGVSYRRDEDQ